MACRAVEQMEENAYWQDDFSFPLTFYDYGAEEYRLGEQTLKAENLAAGMLSSAEMVFGKQDNVSVICAYVDGEDDEMCVHLFAGNTGIFTCFIQDFYPHVA